MRSDNYSPRGDAVRAEIIWRPFVTGAAALLMEWGIVRGNDPFLYGEKVKAYLRRGARRMTEGEYPNEKVGYGEDVKGVRLNKVSKIKCFRSFSQHRNEALLP